MVSYKRVVISSYTEWLQDMTVEVMVTIFTKTIMGKRSDIRDYNSQPSPLCLTRSFPAIKSSPQTFSFFLLTIKATYIYIDRFTFILVVKKGV